MRRLFLSDQSNSAMASSSSSSSQSRAGQISEVYICLWVGDISDLLLSDVLDAEDPKVTPCFHGESLMKDIKGLRLIIIVISERFLRSVECMDNLVRVFDQRKRGKLIVKPIFFYLDPEKVRAQTGGVGRELAFHEELRGVDPNKVKRWREALSELGSLSGWSFVCYPYEIKLVQSNFRDEEVMLVERVVKELEAMFADAPMNDIGLRETVHSPSSAVASPSQSQGGGSSQVYVSFLNYDVPVNFLNCLIREVGQKQIRRHINNDDPGTVKFNHSNVEAIEDSQIAIIVISGDYVHSRRCMKEVERIMECQNFGKLIVRLVLYNLDPWEALHHVCATPEIDPWTKNIFIRAFMEKHDLEWDYDGSRRAEIARRILADVKDMLNNVVDNRWSYDVFLSFRGRDTRNTIISHLYNALVKKGVRTFKDNPELEPGQRRSELFEALEKSCIAIIMFSENYACSKWCLDELKLIMDLVEQNKLTIIPIFYRVTPEEVRLHGKDNGENGCYQIALEEMEAKYGMDNPEMVKSWKKALWKGGDRIGFSLTEGKDEANFVDEVTKMVVQLLKHVPLEVARYPIGIADLLKEVEPLLEISPHCDKVLVLGIWGPGGVGKTTLSKAICNDIAHKFDDWCFLSNVRETPLIKLQKRLLRELLSEKDLKVSSVDQGKTAIQKRLRNKRVLVILDDADKVDQLDALAGGIDWFGKGSRIIITTRDSHVLNDVQCKYEVKLLDKVESGDLFRCHASGGRPENLDIDPSLVDRFLDYANGLPLALVLLGRSLYKRSASDWKSSLEKLKKKQPKDIISILKISFDGLEEVEQEIFLDIACFFKGWNKDSTVKILAYYGFDPMISITILVERSLVTIEDGKFQMHDLIEAMGKSIACGLKDDEIPNRIWSYDNFCDILSKNMGQERRAIKGILLNLMTEDQEHSSPSTFEDFKRLRLLIVRNVLAEGSLCFSNELRWFEWPKCSAPAIDFTSSRKLVEIDLRWSKITKIMGKDFQELKCLNLCNCKLLEALPNLSSSSNLEELKLMGCEKLSKLDDPIGSLDKLVHLELKDCCNLAEVPSLLRSKDFQTINFSGCSKLDKFPAIKEELLDLTELDLEKTAVKELPDSIGNLVAVKILNLSSCKELSVIPSSIFKLRALEKLLVGGCPKLEMFPGKIRRDSTDDHGFPKLVLLNMQYCHLKDVGFLSDLTCFETLKEVNLSGNAFAHVPECISKFKRLEQLWLSYCKNLVKLPEVPSAVKLHIMGCQNLRSSSSLYPVIREFQRSFLLDLSNCPLLDLHDLDTSLLLKEIRKLQRSAEVIVAKKDFPRWMDFQITDRVSNYTVPLPQGISEDDILGLAVSVTFEVTRSESGRGFSHEVSLVVGDYKMYPTFHIDGFDGAHTWFLYIPRRPHFEHDLDCAAEINWSNITLGFEAVGASLEICGVRVVLKNELDEQRFMIQKIEPKMDYESEDEADKNESHYDSDHESGQEEDQSPDSLR